MDWTQKIRIRQLWVLIKLYEARNMTSAASEVGMSQPALSKWLSELEAEVGAKLFLRTTRGFQATPVCDELIVHARMVVGEMERSRATVAIVARGAKSSLAIGTSPPATTSLIPDAIHRFREIHPDVHLAIHENTINFLLPQLRAAKLDFLIVRLEHPELDSHIRYDLLYQEEIRLVVGVKHPLAGKRKLDWPEVVSQPWIGPALESPLRRELEHELALAGQTAPQYQIETTSTLVQVGLLQEGSLVAVMSARMAKYFKAAKQVAILPLNYQRRSAIGVLSLRNALPTVYREAFFEALKASTRA
ncbi:MAG: LysR family transcriptional regulator [Pseudomonadota bacterium]